MLFVVFERNKTVFQIKLFRFFGQSIEFDGVNSYFVGYLNRFVKGVDEQ